MIESGIQKGVIPNVNPKSAANSYWTVFVANLFHYKTLIEVKNEKGNRTIDLFEDVIRFCFQRIWTLVPMYESYKRESRG